MSMIAAIIITSLVILCVGSNIYVTMNMTAKEMAEEFIKGQCFAGKIFANIFYAPAWFFKGLRIVVLMTIK